MSSASDPSLAARYQMVRQQLEPRGICDARVLEAMLRVPRESFIDPALASAAYEDRALGIECGQTISQPFIVAEMTQSLSLAGGERVLEIGTGSGYQTAVLAELAREVVTVERHERLSDDARAVLDALGYRNIRFVVGDGTQGWPDRAPYDRIIVTAAAPVVPPPLWQQLREGGVMVIPLGGPSGQVLVRIEKVAGEPRGVELGEVRFVPFIAGPASS